MSDMKSIVPKAWEVQAILEGRKTVTRKPVKGYALEHLQVDVDGSVIGVYQQDEGAVFPAASFAPYQPGDILFVRETWGTVFRQEDGKYAYRADPHGFALRWHSPINMPREAARLFLRVTGVRVERLQDITEEDVIDEGAEPLLGCDREHRVYDPELGDEPCWNNYPCQNCPCFRSYPELFWERVWEKTIRPKDRELYGWAANPWVWVIEFERISKEEAFGA